MNPFSLKDETTYQSWRQKKLAYYPARLERLFVNIHNPAQLHRNEISLLQSSVAKYNLVFYRFTNLTHNKTSNKQSIHALARQLGLHSLDNNICADSDSLTSIEVRNNTNQHQYIPYTQRKLSWHTDGYYNPERQKISSFLLHCVQAAMHGGENMFMDTEIAYILLRDANPDYIEAFMQPDAMTIPANVLNNEVIRAEQTGPVFSISTAGHLHMRYSARLRNIAWKDNKLTADAAAFLQALWKEKSPYRLKYQLKAGEGIVCNNILHNRTAFEDSTIPTEKRLLYRGRYYNRITSLPDLIKT